MNGNSTLVFIFDSTEGVNDCIDIDEMLDPYGKSSLELERTFRNIQFSPSNEVLERILMNA